MLNLILTAFIIASWWEFRYSQKEPTRILSCTDNSWSEFPHACQKVLFKAQENKIINMPSKTRRRSLLIQLFMSNFIFPFHSAHFVEENNSLLSLVLHSRAPAFFFFVCFPNNHHHRRRHTWRRDAMPNTLSRFEMRKFEYTKKLLKDILFFVVYESWNFAKTLFIPLEGSLFWTVSCDILVTVCVC